MPDPFRIAVLMLRCTADVFRLAALSTATVASKCYRTASDLEERSVDPVNREGLRP